MPNTKETIIDGVDVRGCEYFAIGKCIKGDNVCSCDADCSYAAVYLKEYIQVLNGENERLKDRIATLIGEKLHISTLYNRYRKKVPKIREMAQRIIDNGKSQCWHLKHIITQKCDICGFDDRDCYYAQQILNIIKEVKDE